MILLKKGLISINTKSIKIGASESTRHLIQNAIEYANAVMAEAESNLPKNLDSYRTKFVICKATDILERAIYFNNISLDDLYINSKCATVYSTVLQLTDDPYFKTEEFRTYCYNLVSKLFRDIYKMTHQD